MTSLDVVGHEMMHGVTYLVDAANRHRTSQRHVHRSIWTHDLDIRELIAFM